MHCCHQALIKYAACIFRAVIISRPSAPFFLMVKHLVSAYVSFPDYSLGFVFLGRHTNPFFWTCSSHCGVTLSFVYSKNIPAFPHRTDFFHVYRKKTYCRCHHLFNKQFGSWFMQWIANGAAATKFRTPVWFMAAIIGTTAQVHWVYLYFIQPRYSVMLGMTHADRADYIWSFLTSEDLVL